MSIGRSSILLLIFSFIDGIRLKSTRIWHFILSDNKRHLISSVNKAVGMIRLSCCAYRYHKLGRRRYPFNSWES